jgi:two-component system OmpR family response regulator
VTQSDPESISCRFSQNIERVLDLVKTTESKKILLVEDDDNIRLITRTSLEGLTRWSVIEANSGQVALTLAGTELPDLILLDIMMPGMDGPTTFTRLKEDAETAAIPVIFMTAKVQTQELEEYIKLGAAGVITKPIDPMLLPEQITGILEAAGR